MADINYEFGETAESKAFWGSHADAWPHFERLLSLVNRCFGREFDSENRAAETVFHLGQACRDDFFEIVFLAVHGYGDGATKLLRGMFERAVTAAYLIKNPEEAERFVRFGAIQDHRTMEAALKVFSAEEFDDAVGKDSVAEIRKLYQEVKPEFETKRSSDDKPRIASSWHPLDVASMAHSVGRPFQHYYLGAYAVPNLLIHATAASIVRKPRGDGADSAFKHALALMLVVIMNQNDMYRLGMDEEIETFSSVLMEWTADSMSQREARAAQ